MFYAYSLFKVPDGFYYLALEVKAVILIRTSEWLSHSPLADMHKSMGFCRMYGILPSEYLEDYSL
jgi:hypothetical protein